MTVLGLLALAGWNLHAQVLLTNILPVNVQWTVQSQGSSTLLDGVLTGKVKTSRFTSTDLLGLLATAYGTNFPAGAKLVLVNYVQVQPTNGAVLVNNAFFQVQAAAGAILVANASKFLTYNGTSPDANLFQGKVNVSTLATSGTSLGAATIRFDDFAAHRTAFVFSGIIREQYFQNVLDRYQHRVHRYSATLNGMGSGTNNGSFFIVSGKITTGTLIWLQ